MIHKSKDGNPAAEQQLLTIFSSRGMGMGKMAKQKGPCVRLHGLNNLDEAMAIKSVMEEKGLNSAVTLNPGDFEYYIKVKGHNPFSFEVKIPVDFNIDEARSLVNDAVTATEDELPAALKAISDNPVFTTVSEDIFKGIHAARVYLTQTLTKDQTMNSPETTTEDNMNPEHIASIVSAATNKSVEDVQIAQSAANESINQPTEESQATMNINQPSSTTTETIDATIKSETVTTNAGEQTTGAPATARIVFVPYKYLYVGLAAVAVVGLGVLGWKNADKIGTIFKRTPA